jgi:hypothetical protein
VLRTNLSTRPFYNERAVHLLLAIAAIVVAVLTAFNAIRIISLSRQNTDLSSLFSRDRVEAQRFSADAQRIRATIDQDALKATAEAASAANNLIDQRTFSWTEFFNRIEETLPADVMLTSVHPSVERGQSIVRMTVLGRGTEDIQEFIEQLEATGAFSEVFAQQNAPIEDGLYRGELQARYTPGAAKAVDAAAPQQPAAPEPAPGTPQPEAGPPRGPEGREQGPESSKPARGGPGQ